jgi:saccharopine dehydrogenase (NAD+, L-lysine-forming)
MKLTLGIIKETKKPIDKRTPLTPKHCAELFKFFPGLEILVQPCLERCFKDEEYLAAGAVVSEDLTSCDILLGVKEVSLEALIPNKTYLFFSHTIKKQLSNRALLREILKKNITLVDYETLTWDAGNRIIGFGRFAGIVGTHYAFLMLGRKYGYYSLTPAHELKDYADLVNQYKDLVIPPMRIVLCGDGRVAHGSLELMRKLKIRHVSQEEFLEEDYNIPVYVHLRSEDYYSRKDGRPWDKADFYKHPEDYYSTFKPYFQKADVFINAVFWREGIEPFFTHEQMKGSDFRIKIISDISCDTPGPVPSTIRSTTIAQPFYGYNVFLEKEVPAFLPNALDVQAVGNLPCELPIDASIEFGEQLIRHVLPLLFTEDKDLIIENATIARAGKLTAKYSYLQDFVD